MERTQINRLRIPLYKLYYVSSIDSIEYDDDFITTFRELYEQHEIDSIGKSLKWAKANINYDFKELLPNMRFNNKEIYQYLLKLYEFMKNNNLISH